MDKISLLFQHEEMVHKSIRMADQKATILLTINSALLFALLQVKPDLSLCWAILFYTVSCAVLITIMMCFWVIKPRGQDVKMENTAKNILKDDPAYSLLFIDSNAQEKDENCLTDELHTAYEQHLKKIVLHRSLIDQKKYEWLRWLIPLSMACWGAIYAGMLIYSLTQ